MTYPRAFALRISTEVDVERARRMGRALAADIGFARLDVERIALAVSELATNLLRYADDGEIGGAALSGEDGIGIAIESRDAGPGIADVALALQDGFSTGGGLGGGLPGVRRLMDDFVLATGPEGTTIEARKWLTRRS